MVETQDKLIEENDKLSQDILLELMFVPKERWQTNGGATSVELAKRLDVKTDAIKKKLKALHKKQVVRCSGASPKVWIFDEYNFNNLPDTDPALQLLARIDEVDFSKYFN